jgi:hypothetical protein
MWLALLDIALTNASICYFLENQELKKKEGHRRHCYATISTFLVEQGEMNDVGRSVWEQRQRQRC